MATTITTAATITTTAASVLRSISAIESPIPDEPPISPSQTQIQACTQPQDQSHASNNIAETPLAPALIGAPAKQEPPVTPLHPPAKVARSAFQRARNTSIELQNLPPRRPLPALVPVVGTAPAPNAGSSTEPTGSRSAANAFPPLGLGTRMKERILQLSSFTLSLAFLSTIAGMALLRHIPPTIMDWYHYLNKGNYDGSKRPFYATEKKLHAKRRNDVDQWARGLRGPLTDGFVPSEGGTDNLVCDVRYYARRVGLDTETVLVQTDDGFILELWHVFDPRHHKGMTANGGNRSGNATSPKRGEKYPVLLVHGLLQSSGTFCVNDDRSLAFSLAKTGYDVWLGNNRCGFHPRHVALDPSDSRMWAWDIREMATLDLPALVSGVLHHSGYSTLGLVCHSQGTAQALLALSRDYVPELSHHISVVCALAPAAYAGPLVRKPWFRFMSLLPQPLWRVVFGVHSFVPAMMLAHRWMPAVPYGSFGYIVFSFLFGWSDARWERDLRARMFQFAPVHVSSALMWWWLGRDGFAHAGSIIKHAAEDPQSPHTPEQAEADAWYPAGTPPLALWICGNDGLVDGEKLLARLNSPREPCAKVVHAKIIPDYEHLDVLWALDAPEQVNKEVARVLWDTCPVQEMCMRPIGC
ncbi:Sterol esterase 2 [Ceratocystis lukuohia]|uniref:Sterol esterase 2 n=1 Tax=Ceratocystis lukuohia TaxID=2019550 RepID=A0ABR4MCB6_9PEZI